MKAFAQAGLLATAALAVIAPSAGAAAPGPGLGSYVPGEVLIRFQPRLPAAEVRSLLKDDGATVEHKLPIVSGLRLVDLPAGTWVPEAIADAEARPEVLYAEPNWRR